MSTTNTQATTAPSVGLSDLGLQVENWQDKQLYELGSAITSISVNYTIQGASQITIKLVDPDLLMTKNNYFQVGIGKQGTRFIWRGERYMLAAVELSQGNGRTANVKLDLRTEPVQLMKQDRTPQSYKAKTGFEYAKKLADTYNLSFVGQPTTGVKTSSIKVKSTNNKESALDVLVRAANDLQYMCFITGIDDSGKGKKGTLYFASPQWLLGKWGIDSVTRTNVTPNKVIKYVPLVWPSDNSENRFLVTEMPNMRRSTDSPKESEGSAKLWGINAYDLRAGMTVMVYGVPMFEQAYLITSVEYNVMQPEPVSISFATVSKLAPEDKAKVDQKVSEVTVIG
jgi:hypothetical protein